MSSSDPTSASPSSPTGTGKSDLVMSILLQVLFMLLTLSIIFMAFVHKMSLAREALAKQIDWMVQRDTNDPGIIHTYQQHVPVDNEHTDASLKFALRLRNVQDVGKHINNCWIYRSCFAGVLIALIVVIVVAICLRGRRSSFTRLIAANAAVFTIVGIVLGTLLTILIPKYQSISYQELDRQSVNQVRYNLLGRKGDGPPVDGLMNWMRDQRFH